MGTWKFGQTKVNRKTKKGDSSMDIRFINVEHSVKFDSMEDAIKEANRLKMIMDRFAKRTELPFSCLFAVSQLSLRFGEYVMFHNGKKGRPKRKAVSKRVLFAPPETVQPHLHIIIAYTKQEKIISNKLVESITRKYGEGTSRAYDITNTNPLYYFQYVVRQSGTLRYVRDFTNIIPIDFKKMRSEERRVGKECRL